MNVDAAIDFGAYLKTLRADRQLSLEAAERIARSCAESVSSSYLSRLESGKATPKLTKLATLAKVYDVPLHALVERFEWSRRAVPTTRGWRLSSFSTFQEQLDQLWKRGEHLQVLALTGEARAINPSWLKEPFVEVQLDHAECNALVQLGFFELAKLQVEQQLAQEHLTITQQRQYWSLYISCCQRLGRYKLAEAGLQCYESALKKEAETTTDQKKLKLAQADGNILRGNLALEQADYLVATVEFIAAVRLYENTDSPIREARAKASLGSAWIEVGKYKAAHQALIQAWKIASEHSSKKIKMFTSVRLAALEAARENYSACERWALEAKDLAEQLEHRAMKFASTYYLFLVSRSGRDLVLTDRYCRMLKQWMPYSDPRQPEVKQFELHQQESGELA